MPAKTISCRHCNKEFVLVAGKPGLANECPECWAERNPPMPKSAKPVYKSIFQKREKTGRQINRLIKQADELIEKKKAMSNGPKK
ncbi:MAG TPA: hypothetical protein VJ521_06965 [Acidobacteriota bacterium]|nr:hypothetical protein [Acidobacteriota bacterium]